MLNFWFRGPFWPTKSLYQTWDLMSLDVIEKKKKSKTFVSMLVFKKLPEGNVEIKRRKRIPSNLIPPWMSTWTTVVGLHLMDVSLHFLCYFFSVPFKLKLFPTPLWPSSAMQCYNQVFFFFLIVSATCCWVKWQETLVHG